MSEDGNWWDPFCPCLVTRKNIVMTTLAFCCIALVTWTVVVTAKDPANNNLIKSNVTFIVIEDSKTIANLNLTMKSALTIKKVDEAYNKAIKKVSDKFPPLAPPKTVLQVINNKKKAICKCICSAGTTKRDMRNALNEH
uniref:Tetraspanin31Blike [Bombyx mori] n=1 Tax=Lepeophtheirus salmonis TaxID=72036 RepID=A0A0K2UZ45_LEPSM|nr:uncharacterized protein LOC121119652 [Lepeophtheirus salmonis]